MMTPLSLQECMSRRERLEAIGGRVMGLTTRQAAYAWDCLSTMMVEMGEPDTPMPKFNDLLLAIWRAAHRGRKIARRNK